MRQPPWVARLPGFFFRVDLPRSRLRFCPVGRFGFAGVETLEELACGAAWPTLSLERMGMLILSR